MDDTADEHNFSDDDFEELHDTALRELENNAVISTQQTSSQAHKARPPSRSVPAIRRLSAVTRAPVQAHVFLGRPPPHLQEQNLIDEDFEDDSFEWVGDEQVSTPVEDAPSYPHRSLPGETTQREQWRQERFNKPNAQPVSQRQHLPPQYNNYPRPQALQNPRNVSRGMPTVAPSRAVQPNGQQQNDQDSSLRAQLEDLMKERDQLTRDLHTTKTQVLTQQGEIAIIRDNKNKETKVFDRQLSALKKSMQEESSKHETTLATLTNKNKEVAEVNSFLEHELKEETEKSKALSKRLKQRPAEKSAGPTTTPKKGPAKALGDGFDDDEIMVMSPSKSAKKSKPPTPTAAANRKRKAAAQSPIKPLALRQTFADSESGLETVLVAEKSDRVVPIMRRDRRTERHLHFMQRILNYQLRASGERIIEKFMGYRFPSDASRTLAAIILDATSRLKGPRLPADMLQIFLDVWVRCLREKYYDPVSSLIDVTDFMIELEMTVVDKTTITNIIPILQDSATLNGYTRFKHSPVFHGNFGQFHSTPKSSLNESVSGNSCVELMYKIACILTDDFALINHFWRVTSTDFVLMMLNPWQPISDLTLILHLLATSIFPGTFGNVCADTIQQDKMEGYIIDRVCWLLWEVPKVDEGLAPPTKSDICRFRIEALNLLTTLAIDSSLPPHDDPKHHGVVLLTSHASAIARLVRSLYDEVAQLYMFTSSSSLHAQLINMGVCLLHNLLTLHGEELDMQKKLSAVNGGVHKFRVVLTRLAFSEGYYVDKEISDETVARATNMLEDSVTPDEAEMMIEAFPNFVGRRRDVDEMDERT